MKKDRYIVSSSNLADNALAIKKTEAEVIDWMQKVFRERPLSIEEAIRMGGTHGWIFTKIIPVDNP